MPRIETSSNRENQGAKSFLNMRQAAAFLGVSVRWLQEGLRRGPEEVGSIPAYRLPCRGTRQQWRFDPDELGDWLRAGSPPVSDWRRIDEACKARGHQ